MEDWDKVYPQHFSMATVSLTRRQLLQRTALAGGALGIASNPLSSWAQGERAANDRIQVALIGLGVRGRAHLKVLLERKDVRVVAIADVDEAHRRMGKQLVGGAYGDHGVKDYEDFRELIAAGGVDAAVIAVPNHWHALIAIACAEAGMDVYGETPLAHTVIEGRAICRAVKRYGRVWQTGNQLRSDPLFQRACGYVAGGSLGVVRSVEIGTFGGIVDLTGAMKEGFVEDADAQGLNYDLWLGPAPWLPYHPGMVHGNWRWHQAFGGGQLMSWVGQYADIALWALGLDKGGPIKVEATGEFARHRFFNVPVRYDVEALFFNDLKMQISSSLAPGIRWHGDNGWIYVAEDQLLASSPDLLQVDDEDSWALGRFSAHGHDHWQDFFHGVRTRLPTLAPCESAHRAATLGHLGMLALTTGRGIAWKPESETVFEDPNAAERLEIGYRKPWLLTD